MAKEIIIRVTAVSPELTRAASEMIATEFGGYFRMDGFGSYTFSNWTEHGGIEECASVAWYIGTAAKDSARFEFVVDFAAAYCEAGNQESIYFLDSDGVAYLVFADGRLVPLS